MEFIIAIAGTVIGYGLYAIWDNRKEQLREYTHVADIYEGRLVRVRSDEEGRAIMNRNC